METVKRLMDEIEGHLGRDSAHPSADPKKLQVESQEHEHKLEVSSITKNHIESDHEDILQVNSGLQEEKGKVKSKSVEETHTAEDNLGTYDDSKKKQHKEGQGQVQVQERAFQVLARGAKPPTVKSGSPGQYH